MDNILFHLCLFENFLSVNFADFCRTGLSRQGVEGESCAAASVRMRSPRGSWRFAKNMVHTRLTALSGVRPKTKVNRSCELQETNQWQSVTGISWNWASLSSMSPCTSNFMLPREVVSHPSIVRLFPCLLFFFKCVRKSFLSVPFMNQTLSQRWRFTAPDKCEHASSQPMRFDFLVSFFVNFTHNSLLKYAESVSHASRQMKPITFRKWRLELPAVFRHHFRHAVRRSQRFVVQCYWRERRGMKSKSIWGGLGAEPFRSLRAFQRRYRPKLVLRQCIYRTTCSQLWLTCPIESPPGRFIALMLQSTPFLSPGLGFVQRC